MAGADHAPGRRHMPASPGCVCDLGHPDTDGVPRAPLAIGPGHLGSHTSAVNFGFGVLAAVLLVILPGAAVALAGRLNWPVAVAVGPALTYGVVGLTILPFGALGVPWNALTALLPPCSRPAVVLAARVLLAGSARAAVSPSALGPTGSPWRRGVLFGAVAIGYAAWRGMPNWQSVPEHLGRRLARQHHPMDPRHGQASPTHMGELRNVETHDPLYSSVDVPRPGRRAGPADRRRADHRRTP